MSSKQSSKKSVPEWVNMGRQTTVIYDILAAPYEEDCDCKTCKIIRANEEFLASIFRAPTPGSRR